VSNIQQDNTQSDKSPEDVISIPNDMHTCLSLALFNRNLNELK